MYVCMYVCITKEDHSTRGNLNQGYGRTIPSCSADTVDTCPRSCSEIYSDTDYALGGGGGGVYIIDTTIIHTTQYTKYRVLMTMLRRSLCNGYLYSIQYSITNYTVQTVSKYRSTHYSSTNQSTMVSGKNSLYPTASEYLHECKQLINYINQYNQLPKKLNKLCIVFGNEACDLDSMVSSLITAYYHSADTISQLTNNSNTIDTITIPLCNMKYDDYMLRGEASYAFDKAGIKQSDLLFLNDINLQAYQQLLQSNLQIILVDHNKLAEQQSYLNNNVFGIYDHHVDSQQHNDIPIRIIETVGSCVTLPTAELIHHKSSMLLQYTNKGLCELIECVILLDTDNMSKQTKKATQKDIDTLAWLDATIHQSEYKLLKQLRSDVSQLNTIQLLNRDTKYSMNEIAPHAIASLPISLQQLQTQDNHYLNALNEFCQQHKLSFAIVLTSYTDKSTNKHARQLLVYVPAVTYIKSNKPSTELLDYIVHNLESCNDILQLQRITHPAAIHGQTNIELNNKSSPTPSSHIVAYNQLNISSSRKQVLPLVDNIIARL